ncbi:MAG: hypothetical protein F6J98_26150 [Moorea sp. SIO4G2]|uniref:hypothetical protein n=1 Tax=unclassified Moorena TaxID=2683338 RepID=UPI00117E16BC|nr:MULTISPECIES: hypothetical protein [unclassified Moorena]NEO12253.1 hypothetical protein [Moorena sp. SIO3E8]NEO46989.1 hypothetical protein [Moorena sp. SIO4A3]NEO63722.1 hypothetical protein [Moorena sp. SIO4G2]
MLLRQEARAKRQEARGKRVLMQSASKKTVPDQQAFGEQLNNQTTKQPVTFNQTTCNLQPNNL